jgi:P4 family phage/plasmid primase-like protien
MEWWALNPGSNVGLLLGRPSNVVRLDADGQEAVKKAYDLCGEAPSTKEYVSPSGGRGWLFEAGNLTETVLLWNGAGDHQELRLQGDGAQCILPPSPGWTWINDGELSPMPPKLRSFILSIRAAKMNALLERELAPTVVVDNSAVQEALKYVLADDRKTWLDIGMALHSAGDNLQLWIEWSKTSDKFVEGECEEVWAKFSGAGGITVGTLFWYAKQGGYKPRHEPLTDLGNANILARTCKTHIKHSSEWGWLAWDGKRWCVDGDAHKKAVNCACEVVRMRANAALKSLAKHLVSGHEQPDFEEKKKRKEATVKSVRRFEDGRCIKHSVELASASPLLTVDYRLFNIDPYLFNCANGTLDLRTMELHPHDPDDLLTGLADIVYDPSAPCSVWSEFLRGVFADNGELIRWIQRLLGYCLTGLTNEHVLIILHGTGCNGKTTFINTVASVFGECYACKTPANLLAKTYGDPHPERLVNLYGKRFAYDSEMGDSVKLNEELVKMLTGGDVIRARNLYQRSWEFKPTHKLFVSTNSVPMVRGTDDAIWRRLKLVPFNVSFLGKEDKDLTRKLFEERSGVLSWIARGCVDYIQNGLGEPPAEVLGATNEYRSEQDSMRRYFDECLEFGPEFKERKAAITASYKSWCTVNSVQASSDIALGKAIRKQGASAGHGAREYLGVRIIK